LPVDRKKQRAKLEELDALDALDIFNVAIAATSPLRNGSTLADGSLRAG
jgi:hypothetical protein